MNLIPSIFFIIYYKIIILSFFVLINASNIPEIISYAKVSRNGATSGLNSEGRNFQIPPMYPKMPHMQKGEVIDYPSTQKYSTLDKEMVAKLDAKTSLKQAQDRFVPQSNKLRLSQTPTSSGSSSSQSLSSSSSISSGSYVTLPKQLYSQYPGYVEDSSLPPKNGNKNNNLPSITIDDYSPASEDSYSQIPDSYKPQDSYQNDEKLPSFIKKNPKKPDNHFPEQPYQHSSYFDDHYLHNHDYESDQVDNHELIYDHPPDHYEHDYLTTTTEAAEMNDQRLSKRPYSYYYIGKKLWYLPLYFSIYFIIYIAALILKSIARHKINFPSNLAEAANVNAHGRHLDNQRWWDLTQKVLEGIEGFADKNVKQSSIKRKR